jgi:hypothetical protein
MGEPGPAGVQTAGSVGRTGKATDSEFISKLKKAARFPAGVVRIKRG